MAAGRPLKFKTIEELQKVIDCYFAKMAEPLYFNKDGAPVHEPLTITGLALALDTTRQTLMDYQEREEFTDAIRKAKTRVENYAEQKLFGSTPTGPIFALKNFGWDDKNQQEVFGKDGGSIKQDVTVTYVDSKNES